MKLLKFGLLAAAVFAVAHAEEEFDEGKWRKLFKPKDNFYI